MAESKAKLQSVEWTRFLRGILNKTADASGILRTVYATIGFADIIGHFNAEKNSDGSRWARLKESTVRSRGQKNPRILRDTGNLRNSFSPTNAKKINRQSVLVFNNANYSAQHDQGNEEENLPKREFMYLTDRALEKMAVMILDRIT